jgi:hypothetical protein
LFLDENDYITERNYIIADEIEPEALVMIYQFLRDHSHFRMQKPKVISEEAAKLE